MSAVAAAPKPQQIRLIGGALEILPGPIAVMVLQPPFALHVPHGDLPALCAALRSPSADPQQLLIDGVRATVNASALKTVRTLIAGAFIFAMDTGAAVELAAALERAGGRSQGVLHA